MRKKLGALILTASIAASTVFGQSTAPVDLAETGTNLVTWAGEAAQAGIVVLAIIVAVKVMKKVFKSAAG